MNRVSVTLIAIAAFVLGAGLTAHAQKTPATQVIAHEETKTVRIVIDGRTVAVFDEAGLHVRDGIEYGETITDTGADRFDAAYGDRKGSGP